MSNRLIGYQSGQGFLYDLSGASKMLFFILVSVACMATYDQIGRASCRERVYREV